MADGHGGYRQPAHPAAVSPPGALSQRTDGGPTDTPPMVAPSPMGGGGAPAPQPGPSRESLPGLTDPSMSPNEPVTAGADAGLGINSAQAGITSPDPQLAAHLQPIVSRLDVMSRLSSTTPETKAWLAALKQHLGGVV